MKFTKTLLAAALMAGTGIAQASIATTSAAAEDAILQVYDSVLGQTYNLDLVGATVAVLAAAQTNHTVLSWDLSKDSLWTTSFAPALKATSTSWGVLGGYGTSLVFTTASATVPVVAGKASAVSNVSNAVVALDGRYNAGLTSVGVLGVSVNGGFGSTLVNTAQSTYGAWAQSAGSSATLTNVESTFATANAAIAWGATGTFAKNTGGLSSNTGAFDGAFYWTGSTLNYNYAGVPVQTAVPLPAAVWLFGAGLMAVLRLNRRKSAAI